MRATGEPLDDDGVWSLTCFVVRTQYRGRGLNSVLLAAAVDLAERSGARMIEAYPVDTSHGEHRPNDLYHAKLSTFVSAGFTVGPALTGGRVLVSAARPDLNPRDARLSTGSHYLPCQGHAARAGRE